VADVDQAPVSITLIQPGAADVTYPHPGRAQMYAGPGSAAPVLDPMLVAQAILRAATEGAREVRVDQGRLPRPGLDVAAMVPAARPMAKHA